MNKPATALLAALSIVIAASPRITVADAIESPGNILAAARSFLEEQLATQDARTELRIGGLDARLRLAACDRPLQGFLPPGGKLSGNTSVGVECAGTQPWKLYVQAYVGVFKTVAVASGYLAAGTVLGPDNIRMEDRDVTASGYGYLSDIEQVQGLIMKQPLQDGRVIPPQAVTKAKLVRRGESVVILSRNGGIEVRMDGSALMDGTEGDRIKVRNSKSKRVIEGRVEAPGLVMVSM
ncbi:MAG: flagellar basal body P-ring formation protein FlgA [Gammaproteobacteria bacterium]|nr:flagellar basal body P-ring formation protein FlgA [Gammaproteobacteria bacterium]